MNNKYIIKNMTATVLLSFATVTSAMAQSVNNKPATLDCSLEDGYLSSLKTHLTDLQEKAVKLGQEICLSSLKVLPDETIEINQKLEIFASEAKLKFDKMFPNTKFDGASELSQHWYDLATRPTNDYRNWALIEGERKLGSSRYDKDKFEMRLYADSSSKAEFDMNEIQIAHCADAIIASGIAAPDEVKDCKTALYIWSNAVSPFQSFYTNRLLVENEKKITHMQSQWKTFIEEARYQTPLDVWVTTTWYRDQYKRKQLTGPPAKQLFLLHPAIVYEHLPDAEKGGKEDVSVAIEWVGINWWRSGFGFSVTSVYKDRDDQPSVGTGITFHVKNKYSLGYAYRDNGDDSIFFNIDLLEWFGKKDEKYKKYKAYIE